jgi:hypothetical protein
LVDFRLRVDIVDGEYTEMIFVWAPKIIDSDVLASLHRRRKVFGGARRRKKEETAGGGEEGRNVPHFFAPPPYALANRTFKFGWMLLLA